MSIIRGNETYYWILSPCYAKWTQVDSLVYDLTMIAFAGFATQSTMHLLNSQMLLTRRQYDKQRPKWFDKHEQKHMIHWLFKLTMFYAISANEV